MRRLTLAAVVLFSVAAIVVTRHSLEAILLSVARSRTGRELRVQGSFESRWLTRTPSLEATRVTIGDPPWMAPGQTAEVGRLLIELRWRAAWPPFEISRLEIDDATLHLVRTREGRANWQSAPGQSGSGPPLIRSLAMRNAQVELHDDRRHLEFRGTVTAGDGPGDGSHPPPLRIDARGVLNGRPMTLRIEGEPLATASPSQPYHFSLDELSSASHLSGRLQLERPFDFRHLAGRLPGHGAGDASRCRAKRRNRARQAFN